MLEYEELQESRVVKFLEFRNEGHNQKNTTISVTFDYQNNCIRMVVLKGIYVCVEKLLYALLADKDFRRLIKKYRQELQRGNQLMKLEGRQDIFITNGRQFKVISKESIIRICTILDFKNVKNQRNPIWMHVDDILKMCADFGITDDTSRKYLIKLADVKYVSPKCINEMGF